MSWHETMDKDWVNLSKAEHIYIEEFSKDWVNPFLVKVCINGNDYSLEEFKEEKTALAFIRKIIKRLNKDVCMDKKKDD